MSPSFMRRYIKSPFTLRQRWSDAITLVSHRAQFIFLRTHKTASTSVEAALEPLCLPDGAPVGVHHRDMSVTVEGIIGARGGAYSDRPWVAHMSARRVRRMVGIRTWRRYKRIAVVRNPYDRLVSMFWWRLPEVEREALASAPFPAVRTAFAQWLRTAKASKNTSKLCIGPRYCLSHVLHFERLDAEVSALFSLLGEAPQTLPRYKSGARSREEPFAAYYDRAEQRLVERQCGFELAFFGYDLRIFVHPLGFVQRFECSPFLTDD